MANDQDMVIWSPVWISVSCDNCSLRFSQVMHKLQASKLVINS